MLRDQFRRLAGREQVPLGTIEKDYMTSLMLAILEELPSFPELAFKGGTCIRKVYFSEARFSVDLDFTVPEKSYPDLWKELEQNTANRQRHGISFLEIKEEERGENGARLSIKHQETSGHPTSLKLDLSFREQPVEKAEWKDVLNPYGYELPACQVKAFSLEEILAEKFRAAIARGAPRDVYDIWFLLQQGVAIRWDLISQKLQMLREDTEFDPKRFMTRLEEQREEWQRDLHPLLGEAPDFDQVVQFIGQHIADRH